MYIKLVPILLSSAVITALITPFFRKIAVKNGIFDRPNERKIHDELIPRVGGIAIAIGFLATLAFGYELFSPDLKALPLTGICIGGGIIFYIGLIDDMKGLNAYQKFAGQMLATLTLLPFGLMIKTLDIPFIGVVNIGWFFGLVLTFIWVIGITNAMNLIDGMDGLSSGVAGIASIVIFIASILSGNILIAIISIAILGSTLGFLWHNWNPANIFMGDCGAMFLGFTLAAISIEISYKGGTSFSFFPLLVLGLPIIDTGWAIIRRLWNHQHLFNADQGHIHHRLLKAVFSVKRAVLILYGVCALFGIAALVTTFVKSSIGLAIAVGMLLLSIIGVKLLSGLVTKRTSESELNRPSSSLTNMGNETI